MADRVDRLIIELKSDEWAGRCLAAVPLGDIGDHRAVEPLIKALEDDVLEVRGCAALSLGKIGDHRAAEPLIKALEDGVFQVRATAAVALGKIGDARAVEPLVKALEDGVFQVRGCAAVALGKIGDARAVGSLTAALADKEGRVSDSARVALTMIAEKVKAEQRDNLQTTQVQQPVGPKRQVLKVPQSREEWENILDRMTPHDPGNNWYRSPNIPEKKLDRAIRKYAPTLKHDDVLALSEDTFLGLLTAGCLLTVEGVWHINSRGDMVRWSDITEAKPAGSISIAVELSLADGSEVSISILRSAVRDRLVKLFKRLAKSREASSGLLDPSNQATGNEQRLDYLSRETEKDPQNIDAWRDKGNVLRLLKRYEEAMDCYDQVLKMNPSDYMALGNKGDLLCELKRYEDATVCLSQALKAAPDNDDAVIRKSASKTWYNWGNELAHRDRDESLRCYDEALRIDPGHCPAWANKGLILKELGRYEEAIRCYDKALEIDSKDIPSLCNKAVALTHFGRIDEALRLCDEALRIKPNDEIPKKVRNWVESRKQTSTQ